MSDDKRDVALDKSILPEGYDKTCDRSLVEPVIVQAIARTRGFGKDYLIADEFFNLMKQKSSKNEQ